MSTSERATGSEWILSNPLIDDLFEGQVPDHIPIFDADTDLIGSSCLPKSIKWSGAILREDEVSKFIMELGAETESLTGHDLDAAPPLPESPVAATQPKKHVPYVAAQHVIVVETGEDMTKKIISFAKGGPRSVSIRSATGKVSKVALKRRSTSSEIETHEGLYNIVSLRGSLASIEVEGKRRLTGGLHISLAADGRASFGGLVAGALTAASQVEVTVMSMTAEGKQDS